MAGYTGNIHCIILETNTDIWCVEPPCFNSLVRRQLVELYGFTHPPVIFPSTYHTVIDRGTICSFYFNFLIYFLNFFLVLFLLHLSSTSFETKTLFPSHNISARISYEEHVQEHILKKVIYNITHSRSNYQRNITTQTPFQSWHHRYF